MSLECSTERPWGIHGMVRNDESCARCGWTAPGPLGDAIADAVVEADRLATAVAWEGLPAVDQALAA
ncbi:hypothetical protein [Allosphingosinicella deserti]|uniref:hypothetical protein n=1 Tax=Allosphingosinicella deserti TaxID=2116704 RepID=UPI000D0B5BCF|nr:hypothetical protein [Sphingomonas deserti]